MARPATAWADCDARGRSLKSRIRTKARPAFWPAPAKLKPETVKTESTESFSSLRKWSETCLSTAWVRSSVAPGASCTRL